MPESRDRLSREETSVASYSQRRISRIGRDDLPILFILEDDEVEQAARTPFRWRDTAMEGTRSARGTPRMSPTAAPAASPAAGSGGRRGVLPTWYPRRPLNDITAVVRAMERRERGGDLTPQKKLAKNIVAVENVVMDELHKLNRLKTTPSSKKDERERRVRTLMSMR